MVVGKKYINVDTNQKVTISHVGDNYIMVQYGTGDKPVAKSCFKNLYKPYTGKKLIYHHLYKHPVNSTIINTYSELAWEDFSRNLRGYIHLHTQEVEIDDYER